MRRVALAAALVVVTSALAGCGSDGGGGGGGAPTDASVDDFCTAILDFGTVTRGSGIREYAGQLEDVGTPSDIPADAREGFEILLREAKKVDPNASAGALASVERDLSGSDRAKLAAYGSYVTDTCLKTNLPSSFPSDLPS